MDYCSVNEIDRSYDNFLHFYGLQLRKETPGDAIGVGEGTRPVFFVQSVQAATTPDLLMLLVQVSSRLRCMRGGRRGGKQGDR